MFTENKRIIIIFSSIALLFLMGFLLTFVFATKETREKANIEDTYYGTTEYYSEYIDLVKDKLNEVQETEQEEYLTKYEERFEEGIDWLEGGDLLEFGTSTISIRDANIDNENLTIYVQQLAIDNVEYPLPFTVLYTVILNKETKEIVEFESSLEL